MSYSESVGRRVGILGGGQLGQMLALAARPLGVKTVIVDPNVNCSAAGAADEFIQGSFTEQAIIEKLASSVDVITVEIEHINASALKEVAKRIPVHPSPDTIALIQDKFLQKQAMERAGVPVGKFRSVSTVQDILDAAIEFGYPMMLKSRKLAYDGRGNAAVHNDKDIIDAMSSLGSKGDLYVEQWVPYKSELAVLVARDLFGKFSVYPTVSTIQKDSICHIVIAPAPISGEVLQRAGEVALHAISQLEGAGVYGVEMFELENGQILLNEIAPRVHNSGHYTIEGCVTSQFEQHIRAVAGFPLGDSSMRVPASAMINVLGTLDNSNKSTWLPCLRALSTPGASVHWYSKGDAKAGRKMGHITVCGSSPMEVASRCKSVLGFEHSAFATPAPLVGIIMGSDSDLPTMSTAASILKDFGVPFELTIVSAHRTPDRMYEYAKSARRRGLRVIIAGAGGAAHLPGMVAALTSLPVIGVPIPLKLLDGVDSLHSIVQMPRGVPVATVAIGNSTNAALLAVRILGTSMGHLCDSIEQYAANSEAEVIEKAKKMEKLGWESYMKSS
jgi:phosphoribosylaminoimidazole carboxylase